MAFPDIVIGSSFDGKGFKQAMSSTDKLSKNIKSLAAGFGVAFGTAAVIGFAKKSVKASLEAQAQQERLAALLKVTVGATDAQIAALDAQAAALEKVGVVSAGNITQTQSQLATFNLQLSTIEKLTPAILDYVTAEKGATATTEEFKSMTNGLAQALNGNFTSLTKTGFVLDENTKSIIKNGTESERVEAIVAVLNSTYKDFNKNLRDTPAGQMAVLANAAQEATTVIGTSLLGALQSITKSQDIEELAKKVTDFGESAGKAIEKLGVIIGENIGLLKNLGITFAAIWTASAVITGIGAVLRIVNSLNKAYKLLRATAVGAAIAQAALLNPFAAIAYGAALVAAITAATISIDTLGKLTADKPKLPRPVGGGGFTDSQNAARLAAEKKSKAAADKALRDRLAKEKAAANKLAAAKIAADKKAAANKKILAKAESIFDLEKIQIEAALKGKISADEKLRLELQRAILNEDFELADKLQKRLEASQRATAALQGTLAAIKPVPSPFDEWIDALKEIGETLSKILGINVNTSSSILNPNQPIVATQTPNSPFQEGTIPIPVTTVSDLADAATAAADMATLAANEAAAIAADAAAFASSIAAGAAASVAMIPGNNPHPILPYTGSSSSIFNPYGLSSNVAGWGTNISTVQDTPSMPPIVVNIEGLIDMDNVEGVFNMAMLNAIRKGLPQTIAGALP
jgi:hypothetical protein